MSDRTTIRDSGAVTVWVSDMAEVCLTVVPYDDGEPAEVHLLTSNAEMLVEKIHAALLEAEALRAAARSKGQ